MTVTALVEFLNGTGSNHAAVSAPGRDILVNTRTDTTAKVFGQIKFTVDGLSFLSTDVKNRMNIASTVNLGAYTELSAGNDLSIAALIGSIYALASAYSETGSIINTQSRPTAEVNVTAKAWIRGSGKCKAFRSKSVKPCGSNGRKQQYLHQGLQLWFYRRRNRFCGFQSSQQHKAVWPDRYSG